MSSNELNKDLEGNCCKLHTLINDSAEFYCKQIVQFIYIFLTKQNKTKQNKKKKQLLIYSTSVDPGGEVVIATICSSSIIIHKNYLEK
jgi:hypothetical protein